ncbi:MAG: hypothetical protein L6Q37_10795 [Bdellovibrionaceae bacterium]|nr:hypothetical protein [Pseudobdellovibrionaceae bacterium]NUM58144.1 hypothetical protein [Pseudobdellovibrionaceae bacterium]
MIWQATIFVFFCTILYLFIKNRSIRNRKNSFSYTSNVIVGITHDKDAKCPSCGVSLKKHPKSKTKCKKCGNYIFKRTRPYDNKEVTVTENEAKLIDIEWQKVNGTYAEIAKEYKEKDNIKENLKLKLGKEPSENDIMWSLLNKKIISSVKENNWGEFANTRAEMGNILLSEGSEIKAIEMYVEDAIIQQNLMLLNYYNSESNIKKYLDKPALTSIAGGRIDAIDKIISKLKMNESELENLFTESILRVTKSFQFEYNLKEQCNKFMNNFVSLKK